MRNNFSRHTCSALPQLTLKDLPQFEAYKKGHSCYLTILTEGEVTQSCQCSERLPGGCPSGGTTAPRYPSHGRTSAPHPARSSVTHSAAQVQLLKTSHLTNLGEDFGPEIPWENLANVETFRPRRNS